VIGVIGLGYVVFVFNPACRISGKRAVKLGYDNCTVIPGSAFFYETKVGARYFDSRPSRVMEFSFIVLLVDYRLNENITIRVDRPSGPDFFHVNLCSSGEYERRAAGASGDKEHPEVACPIELQALHPSHPVDGPPNFDEVSTAAA
jgi:hypothetical protein